jgi:hypothetical protein
VTPQTHPELDRMVGYAIHYFRDFVLPAKNFRIAGETERAALTDLRDALSQLPSDSSAEKIQEVVYEIGRRPPFLDNAGKAKDGKPGVSLEWFNMLYQVLLGQEKGPRFGSFVALYGLSDTIEMIEGAIVRSLRYYRTMVDQNKTAWWTGFFRRPAATMASSANKNDVQVSYVNFSNATAITEFVSSFKDRTVQPMTHPGHVWHAIIWVRDGESRDQLEKIAS